jgi:hypothetical protein
LETIEEFEAQEAQEESLHVKRKNKKKTVVHVS